jgi:hypothetical protein
MISNRPGSNDDIMEIFAKKLELISWCSSYRTCGVSGTDFKDVFTSKKTQNSVQDIFPNSTFDIITWWGNWGKKHAQKLISVICAVTLAFISRKHILLMEVQHNSNWMAVDLNIRFPAITRDCLLSSEFLPKWDQPSHPGGLISNIKYKYCEMIAHLQLTPRLRTYGLVITTPSHTSAWCRLE